MGGYVYNTDTPGISKKILVKGSLSTGRYKRYTFSMSKMKYNLYTRVSNKGVIYCGSV
jgi:hypothetical protein